jgi:UPF0755 protein
MTSQYDEAGDNRLSGRNEDELEAPAWVGSGRRQTDNGSDPGQTEASPRPAGRRAAAGPSAPEPVPADALPEAVTEDGYEPFVQFEQYDDRDYVRVPRKPGLLRRVVLSAGILVIFALVALGVGGWWVLRQVDPPGPPGAAVTLTIPEGASVGGIAALLHHEGVIGNDSIFKEYVRFKGEGADGRFQAGTYLFNRHSSMAEALAALLKGPVPVAYAQVTFPEGLVLPDIADRLAKGVNWFKPERIQEALSKVRSLYQPPDTNTLEGLIFPDTYRFEEADSEQAAVEKMVAQFHEVGKEVQLEAGAAKLGYTPYQVITIASLIEREARVPEDRAKIARVIYNRLGADMRLDIDASTAYAVNAAGRTLTQSDLETDSPFNTRLHKGIPPTPIAAPGRASLEAALHPESGSWLYYVLASADGHHYFTDSFSDFNRAVAKAEADGLLG